MTTACAPAHTPVRAPIRVANFNRHFSRRAGGAESYAVSLVEGLADRQLPDGSPEFEVHVFSQSCEHHHPRVIYHKVPGPLTRPRWLNQLLFAVCTWWQTHKGFDVVHSHENTWHGQVQTVHVRPIRFHLLEGRTAWQRALRWLKICTSPRLSFYVWLEAARMKSRAKRVVVAASQLLRTQAQVAYPHIGAQMPVIAPGVAAPDVSLSKSEARAQLGLPVSVAQDTPLVLFVGNDYARKGLPALLTALAILKAEPTQIARAHLLVVGSAGAILKFKRMAQELGVAGGVHFAGPQSQMALAYRAADCLVHPTLEDGFAMVVLEAMSYGLPVVVSSATYCGISAFLEHEKNALILDDPQDAAAIATAINRLLAQPQLCQALADNGVRFAAEHSWQAVVDAYVQIYSAVLDSAMPPTTLLKPPST